MITIIKIELGIHNEDLNLFEPKYVIDNKSFDKCISIDNSILSVCSDSLIKFIKEQELVLKATETDVDITMDDGYPHFEKTEYYYTLNDLEELKNKNA